MTIQLSRNLQRQFPPSLTGEHCTYRDIVVLTLISIPSSFLNFLKNGFLWELLVGYDGSKGTALNEIGLCTNLWTRDLTKRRWLGVFFFSVQFGSCVSLKETFLNFCISEPVLYGRKVTSTVGIKARRPTLIWIQGRLILKYGLVASVHFCFFRLERKKSKHGDCLREKLSIFVV